MNRKLTEDYPCWYDHKSEILYGSQEVKARKFNQIGTISESSDGWLVGPIKGYNKRTYQVKNASGSLACNCQYFMKHGTVCSHTLAVQLFRHSK